jgi:hypothetical protein
MIECMFESVMRELREAARAENRAAGRRLAVIGELERLWLRRFGERETWGTDTYDAITAELAAALGITRGLADSYLDYARAMRVRVPQVGALLVAGDINYRTFQTIVYRTDLITDCDVLAAVDAALALKVARWTGITQSRLGAYVDQVVARADQDAVRRRRERRADREVAFWGDGDGLTEMFGRLHTTDAHAVDARLDALAATVCDADPRTRNQRRADAMGALAIGADRLVCGCGRPDCVAASTPSPSPVVIHVIAEQATVEGTSHLPGSMVGADALIPAELVAELARSAKVRPLIHPADAPPGVRLHTLTRVGRFRPLPRPDLPLSRLRRARDSLRPRPHRPARRRRAHACLQPQGDVSPPPSAENVLGLARSTTPRRHGHLDLAGRADLRHHAGQRPAVP